METVRMPVTAEPAHMTNTLKISLTTGQNVIPRPRTEGYSDVVLEYMFFNTEASSYVKGLRKYFWVDGRRTISHSLLAGPLPLPTDY